MASTLITGCTGLVGSYILSTLRNASPTQVSSIDILARRPPPAAPDASIKINEFVNKDTNAWLAHIASLSPAPAIFFSSLATTRAAAGGFEQQYKIEHDFNIDLAKKAKEAGTKTFVLISSAGANPKAFVAYSKMKGEIEEHVKELHFDHTIIVRPGLIGGDREESRLFEAPVRKLAAGLGYIHTGWLKDPWAQDADVIAKAAIAAALKAESGEINDKVLILGGKDIIRLGRTEWKDLK